MSYEQVASPRDIDHDGRLKAANRQEVGTDPEVQPSTHPELNNATDFRTVGTPIMQDMTTDHGQLTDALSKWQAAAGNNLATIEEIRLDQSERLVIPFTASITTVVTHFVDYPSLRGYLRCNGPDCVLCRIGRNRDERDLLPVYDVIGRVVGVLPSSPNMRPGALRPQLLPVLKRLMAGDRVLLAISKPDRQHYTISILPLADNADDGAGKIADFAARIAAGAVDLASIYQQLANEEIATLPEVATVMKARGISL